MIRIVCVVLVGCLIGAGAPAASIAAASPPAGGEAPPAQANPELPKPSGGCCDDTQPLPPDSSFREGVVLLRHCIECAQGPITVYERRTNGRFREAAIAPEDVNDLLLAKRYDDQWTWIWNPTTGLHLAKRLQLSEISQTEGAASGSDETVAELVIRLVRALIA